LETVRGNQQEKEKVPQVIILKKVQPHHHHLLQLLSQHLHLLDQHLILTVLLQPCNNTGLNTQEEAMTASNIHIFMALVHPLQQPHPHVSLVRACQKNQH
jgi:hypothetical protein